MNHLCQSLLVVEDNEELRFLVTMQLSRTGHQADFAHDGQEAVEKAAKKNYCLILMDIMMPVMDGIKATRLIREQEEKENKARTPIVAMTALAEKNLCLAADMDDFLYKPVMLAQLIEILNRWIPDTKAAI